MTNKYFKLISIMFLCMAFFANTKAFSSENKSQIEDELLQSDYLKNNSQKSLSEERNPITDELLNPNMYKDVPFRLGVYANKYSNEAITDSLLEDSNFIENSKKTFLPSMDTPDEYFIEKNIDLTKVRIIKSKNKYDFTKKLVPIEIKIAQRLKSTRGIIEGSTIPFVAQHDFEINGKKYSSGTTILGRVETISDSDKMGVPESLKISNFYIPDEKEIDLSGTISKIGANRSIWVYPLYQAGNILLYVAGFAVVPIHGGRAKLSTSESFTVFYEAQ